VVSSRVHTRPSIPPTFESFYQFPMSLRAHWRRLPPRAPKFGNNKNHQAVYCEPDLEALLRKFCCVKAINIDIDTFC